MERQFIRNFPALTGEEQTLLGEKHVLVLGCGGLGGSVIEHLVRLGIGRMTVVDGDRFEEANLNRQLLATKTTLGENKALAAKERALAIRPAMHVQAVPCRFEAANASGLLEGIDLVMDGLDSPSDRMLAERICGERGIPIVHGAVCGWVGQVGVALPNCGLLTKLYAGRTKEADKSCLSFTAAFVASVQCAQAVKLLCGRQAELENRLLVADLEKMDFTTLEL